MAEPKLLRAKVCLVGENAVGKTSLIRRFVLDAYDDRYILTIGTKISRKEIPVRLPDGRPLVVNMTIWDIMGSKGFRELLRDAYFNGTQGLLAVADLTRGSTLSELTGWVDAAKRVAGPVPVLVAGNKSDLAERAEQEQGEDLAAQIGGTYVVTSARTGQNVEETFRRLAAFIAEEQVAKKHEAPIPAVQGLA